MNAFLTIGILVCALTATAMADCSGSCSSYCNLITASCNANPFSALLGLDCSAADAQCKSLCDDTFCTCAADCAGNCMAAREACRTGGAAVDLVCEVTFNGCVAGCGAQCFGQVMTDVLTTIIGTAGALIPKIGL